MRHCLSLGFMSLLVFSAAPAHAQQVGISACDEYLTRMEACLRKQGVSDKAQYDSLVQMGAGMKLQAANAQMRPTVENLCKSMMDSAKAGHGPMPQHCAN